MEGALPENAVPVHSFAVGYGEVAAADEEGVTALPMVTVLTNDGKGPMLLLSLDSAPRLIAELTEAVPKSLARFDPDFVAQMAKADEVIERTKRAMRRQERNTFLGYTAALGVILLVTGHTMQGKGDFGLHLIRRFMERQGFACLHRNEEDPPQIMETWL
jgi:hypothetical protein